METRFVNLAAAEVAVLQQHDRVVDEVRRRTAAAGPISFPWLRNRFGSQNGMWDQLGRGKAVLGSADHLDQYLHSYGPMIASQWGKLAPFLNVDDVAFRLVDHGCGQGLAGLLLADHLGSAWLASARSILLVEPSAPALVRAEAIYRGLAPHCPITCIRKSFDELTHDDLAPDDAIETIHLFSNVLDIDGFDHVELFRKLLFVGRHNVLAVSHDRDHDGGSSRILELKAAVEDPKMKQWLSVGFSEVDQFTCNDGKSDAIAWFLQMDVSDG